MAAEHVLRDSGWMEGRGERRGGGGGKEEGRKEGDQHSDLG